jgi:hypothetical protein
MPLSEESANIAPYFYVGTPKKRILQDSGAAYYEEVLLPTMVQQYGEKHPAIIEACKSIISNLPSIVEFFPLTNELDVFQKLINTLNRIISDSR